MKSILFMAINMNIGGTEKALITMLNDMPKEEFNITVLLLEKYGEFLEQIPSWVNVIYLSEYKELKKYINEPPKLLFKELIKERKYIKAFGIFSNYLKAKFLDDISYYYKYLLKDIKKLEKEYDLAVAYAGPMDFITYFVCEKINAKKKAQWIHFDVTKIGFNKKFAEKFYNRFDKIFVVSKEGKEKLDLLIPKLKDKTEVFFNIISSKFINDMANKEVGFRDDFKGIRILTVGRISKEKGQDIIIPVIENLKQSGIDFRWYLIGEGAMKSQIEFERNFRNLTNELVLLGSKINPYPFMKECDLYVQTSRHEGYCITLAEARCFSNPIVTTSFTGANEQIKDVKTGFVVEREVNKLYKAIILLINNRILYEEIQMNLQSERVDSENQINKIINFMKS